MGLEGRRSDSHGHGSTGSRKVSGGVAGSSVGACAVLIERVNYSIPPVTVTVNDSRRAGPQDGDLHGRSLGR
jgi:hypothetical protein